MTKSEKVVIAMMQAVDMHLNQLRAALEKKA